MKILSIIGLIITVILFSQCAASRQSQYNIPSDVPPEVRSVLIERAEKGKILYKKYCSGCHGIFSQGKDGVPNFTARQIDNYHSAALLKIDPRNHAVAQKMSNQQIDYVITFLRIRKPS